jgi:cation diffusion facilitator family transporter
LEQELKQLNNPTKPSDLARRGMRAIVLGGTANLFLAIIKITTGIIGHSYALIADGVESASDIFSSILLYFGLKVASKGPDRDHPYGHGKAEPLSGAAVSFFLILSAIIIVVEAAGNIFKPHTIPSSFTLWILGIIIIVKEGLYRYNSRKAKEIGSSAVLSDAWHHRSDAMSSAAAFVGIAIARIGGHGYESADNWAAMVAAAIIIVNAYKIFRPSLSEIMDTAPSAAIIKEIKMLASKVEGVKEVEKCHVRKMGFEYFVDLHIKVDGEITVSKGHHIAHQVKDTIMQFSPRFADVLIHVEPAD